MPYVTSKLVIDDVQVFLNGIGSTSTRPQRSLSGCRVLTQVVVTALYPIRNIGRCLSYGDNVVAFVHLRNRALLRHRRHHRRRRRHRRHRLT